MSTAEYRVTFGQKYRGETHPSFPEAHPDGWLTIVAEDRGQARAAAAAKLGREWCDMYGPESWPHVSHYFPLGELGRIDAASAVLPGRPVTCDRCGGPRFAIYRDPVATAWRIQCSACEEVTLL